LVISSPLALDKLSVAAGDSLNGTITYQNTSAGPIVIKALAITSRPPGGTNAGGPYNALTPSLAGQTIPAGGTLTLAASRAFTSADPLGPWYAYATYQDTALAWHDVPSVNFTVAAPTPPVAGITASPVNPTDQTTASFSFVSSKAGSTFSCQLDAAATAPCTSPQSYPGLLAGSHTFTVAATDLLGSVSAPASFTWTITVPAGGLVISSPVTLDKMTVAAGDILHGNVAYQNTSASPIAVQAIAITSRPPGGTHAGGPFNTLTPTLAAQTIQPGATVTLAASRAFTSTDPLGAWYAYVTYQDAAGAWHDGPAVNFTVAPPVPVLTVTVSPSVVSTTMGGAIAFQVTVTGTSAGQSTAVTWSLAPGGGSIDTTGAYVAPGVAGTYTVTATSVADTTKIGAATVAVEAPGNVIPLARRTTWNPGIPGGIPSKTTICATVNAATFGNGTTDATSAIQSAINGCPAGQVVFLPAGTYATSSTLNLDHGVVLRGAGPTLTKIKLAPVAGAPVVFIGLWSSYAAPVAVTANVAKGASSLVVANASSFAAGDILQLDQRDDPSYVVTGDCSWYKNQDADGALRSVGQTVEVASVSGNTLNLVSPIHIDFRTAMRPQVTKTVDAFVKNAGIEDLYVTGGKNGMIRVVHAAYSWLRNVESDTVDGQHLSLGNSYRIVVRDSYFHHAVQYSQGGGSYGVSINSQTSDSLIENNVIYFLNKPFLFEASGGGNVVGYNYIDDAQLASSMDWQETDVDTHCSFPHMELIEGNWAPHLGADIVHGNSGWLTFHRNYSSSQHRTLAAVQTSNVEAIGLEAFVVHTNVLGNVLGASGLRGLVYENSTPDWSLCSAPAIYRLGAGAEPGSACTFDPGVKATILRHGNFDYANNGVVWDPAISNHGLPISLYLTEKPAFFGSEAWPFVDVSRDPMVGVLPAKRRFDASH